MDKSILEPIDLTGLTKQQRLNEVLKLAIKVLEDEDNAMQWLREKSLPLGLRTPLEVARSSQKGTQEVIDLLYRIEFTLL